MAVLHADPVLTLFYIGGTAGSAGILILLSLTSVAIAVMFLRSGTTHPARRGWVAAAAVTASVLLGALTVTVLVTLDTLLGVAPDSPLPTVVRLTYAAFFLAGVAWALGLRVRHPRAYATIAETTTARQNQIVERGL